MDNDNDQQKIANHLNEYFTNITPSLVSTIQLRGLRTYKRYLKNKLNYTFEFHSVSDTDVLKIFFLSILKTVLLELIKKDVTKPITLIIN